MASIIPTFEYDIFISYRLNDNRSGLVAEFVNAVFAFGCTTVLQWMNKKGLNPEVIR